MNFVVALALAIGVLVAVPIVAHLLRRGRADEREFPPAALVPVAPPLARQQSRIEDRALLGVRSLLILALAVIGATPLLQCSRLSLSRTAGGSVAMAVVIDDSLSMRAKLSGEGTKWERALEGARELLASAREGDAIAIVVAGAPVRIALSPTTDLTSARHALDELKPSDRATDVDGAVRMARSALKQLPHADKRVVLLSDLADEATLSGDPPLWAPLPELHAAVSDCGIAAAEKRGRRLAAEVVCSNAAAARERRLEVVSVEAGPETDAGAPAGKPGEVLGSVALAAQGGKQTLTLEVPMRGALEVRLTGTDAVQQDDRAAVISEGAAMIVGVNSDPTRSSAATGGATLIEQALASLESGVVMRPITLLPDDAAELKPVSAMILDDPAGLNPEARAALTRWIERGGVAVALLGPRATTVQLGSTLEPFVRGSARWEATKARGVAADAAGWLGSESGALDQLGARSRARLDGTELAGAETTARWDDGVPFAVERRVGRGLVWTVGLPASVEASDFALRPGFLAMLDSLVIEARERSGSRTSVVGIPWTFAGAANVEIDGPGGRLELVDTSSTRQPTRVAVPSLLGAYRVTIDGEPQLRVALLDPAEVLEQPRTAEAARANARGSNASTHVDVSRELGLLILVLLAAELVLRVLKNLPLMRRGVATTV
jgi:hypothetical protein